MIPRTAADMIEDLLTFVEEWEDTYEPCPRNCCGEWVYKCKSCGHDSSGHEDWCELSSLLKEAKAFVAIEREVQDALA